MKKEEIENLKAGDIVKDIDTNKEYVVGQFTVGDGMIWLDIYDANKDIHAWLPYYYWELELVSLPKANKCSCDIMTIMRLGCKCGGC